MPATSPTNRGPEFIMPDETLDSPTGDPGDLSQSEPTEDRSEPPASGEPEHWVFPAEPAHQHTSTLLRWKEKLNTAAVGAIIGALIGISFTTGALQAAGEEPVKASTNPTSPTPAAQILNMAVSEPEQHLIAEVTSASSEEHQYLLQIIQSLDTGGSTALLGEQTVTVAAEGRERVEFTTPLQDFDRSEPLYATLASTGDDPQLLDQVTLFVVQNCDEVTVGEKEFCLSPALAETVTDNTGGNLP